MARRSDIEVTFAEPGWAIARAGLALVATGPALLALSGRSGEESLGLGSRIALLTIAVLLGLTATTRPANAIRLTKDGARISRWRPPWTRTISLDSIGAFVLSGGVVSLTLTDGGSVRTQLRMTPLGSVTGQRPKLEHQVAVLNDALSELKLLG